MIRILCLGNELAQDDGVGIRVGRVLGNLPLPAGMEVVLRPALGFDCLDDCQGCDHLIVVDAASTGEAAGTCRLRALDALAPSASAFASTHALGLRQVLEVAHRLGGSAPAIHVVTIEAASFGPNSVELGPAVAAALPRAVELVLDLVGASGALRDMAREHAARWAGGLTVQELLGGGG